MSVSDIKFSQYKSRAKTKGIRFDLTKADFRRILVKDCFYCKAPNANGIDKYVNDKGYYHGNIVPCCWTCNRAKSDMSVFEFEDYLERFTGELICEKIERENEVVTPELIIRS